MREFARLAQGVFLIICLLLLSSHVHAGGDVVSSSVQFSVTDQNGRSQYTLFYTYPKAVKTGSTFTITLVFVVNTLSGLREYLQDYLLTVSLPVTPHHTISQSVSVPAAEMKYLYPGGRWGPLNITMPINETASGLTPGQRVNANVSLGFLGDVLYYPPISYYYPEGGQQLAGNVVIEDPATLSSLLVVPIILIGVGMTMLVASIFLRRVERRGSV